MLMKKQLVFTVLSTITILMVSCGEPKPIPYGYMEQLPEWAPGYVIDTTLDSYPGEPFNNTLPQNWNGEVYDAEVAYRIFLSRIWNCAEVAKMDINRLEPIRINLVNGQYWVALVCGSHKGLIPDIDWYPSFSLEMRKSDGMLVKLVLNK